MKSIYRAFAAFAGLVVSSTVAMADPRPFTFSNDTYAVGKGQWEFEQHVRYLHHTGDEPGFDRYVFREEFEFGVADNFDLAFYLPTFSYTDSQEREGLRFDSVDVEAVVYLSNPVTDVLGLGLYNEVKVGDESLGYEFKFLVQKDVGNWTFLYNLVLETEIEGIFSDAEEENEVEGELAHTFGVAYAIPDSPFVVGAEVAVESLYADWSHYEGTNVYVGPSLSYQGDPFWVTVTPAFEVTGNDEEPLFQLRAIAGFQF